MNTNDITPPDQLNPAQVAIEIASRSAKEMGGWTDRMLMMFFAILCVLIVIGAGFWLIRYFIAQMKDVSDKSSAQLAQQRQDHKDEMQDQRTTHNSIVQSAFDRLDKMNDKYHADSVQATAAVTANTIVIQQAKDVMAENTEETKETRRVMIEVSDIMKKTGRVTI